MLNTETTIFAPATLIGESSISIIRISGKNSINVISNIFSTKKEMLKILSLDSFKTHTIHHGYIYDGKDLIDEVLIFVFKAPNSYTGEDVIEVSTHGGFYIYRKLSELLIKQGCLPAKPGEFTMRAFINGKIDLTQAEAVADLINSKTTLSCKTALSQLNGELSSRINILREELINYCSLLELEIDFTEEGLELVSKNELLNKIDNIINIIDNLTNSYETGRIIKNGINLTISGQPNAGKSTIFNYFLKTNRAIVSDIPGTTRDYLEETLIMDGIVFNLVDTAGIRKTSDIIEKEGVNRSLLKVKESDIVINVLDLTQYSKINDNNIYYKPNTLTVYNKLDLVNNTPSNKLCVSAKFGNNMDKLQEKIINIAKSMIRSDIYSESIITNERHRDCLLKSCEYLHNARKLIVNNEGNELISLEIRAGIDELGELIGITTNVDILHNIFNKFCIGK